MKLEAWPMRDAIVAVTLLSHEAYNRMEGTDSDELYMQENIQLNCNQFLKALKATDPEGFTAAIADAKKRNLI